MNATRFFTICVVTIGISAAPAGQTSQTEPQKSEMVAVAGCLTEQPAGTWLLTNATEPAPSIPNALRAGEKWTKPMTGKNRVRLIGVDELGLPAYKGKIVLAKGLYVKATPMGRVNVTSVTELAPTCTVK